MHACSYLVVFALLSAANAVALRPALNIRAPVFHPLPARSVAPVALEVPPALTSAAKTSASLGAIVTADSMLRRQFVARAIPFPSSLAGMLGLFPRSTLQAACPPPPRLRRSAAGCDISRWLALFFVPTLVVLPLVLQMSALEFAKLATVIVVGLGASLPLAAITAASVLPKGESSTASTAAAAPAAPSAPAVTQYLLNPPLVVTSALAAGCGGLALAGVAPAFNVFLLLSTVCGFVAGGRVPKQYQKALHPLISCTLLTQATVFLFATVAGRPLKATLRSYLTPGAAPLATPGNLLLFMLGPATLSFGFQMFSRRKLMRQSAKAVSSVTAVAASFGLFATAFAGRLLRMDIPYRLAALPRQVTAPLAIAIAGILKADPSLAATIVVVTGLLCANFGRAVLDALGIEAPVARGLAMGAAGHGLGTAAMVEEKEAFPFAAIAMALNAALSTVLVSVPAVRKLLLAAAGVPAA